MTLSGDPRFHRRGRKITFTFDGTDVKSIDGQSIAAALTASDIRAFRRDRDGHGRGLFCGMGACFECMVSVDGGAGVRACLTKAADGSSVRSLDYLSPVATQPSLADEASTSESTETVDVLIIGAGPAGLSAANGLSGYGLSIMVADERPDPGGQFFKQLATSHAFAEAEPPDSQYADGARLIEGVQKSGTEIISGATVWGVERIEDGHYQIVMHAGDRSRRVSPKRVVIAAGAYERPCAFPGWTLPGVMMTGAAQGLLRSYRTAPGRAIVIAGNGPLNFQLAAELMSAGANVVALAESAPSPFPGRIVESINSFVHGPSLTMRGVKYLRALKAAGVPVLYGHHILEAEGEERLRAAVIAPINGDGSIDHDRAKRLEADTLCLGYGFLPNNELPRLLGCDFTFADNGTANPVRHPDGRSSVPEVFIIGDGGRFAGAHAALSEGQIAAEAILGDLGVTVDRNPAAHRDLSLHHRFQKALWNLFQTPSPGLSLAAAETMICRCENITLGRIDELIDSGISDLGNLKRQSRIGMGRCQGRYCTGLAVQRLKERDTLSPSYPLYATQNPIKPVPVKSFIKEQPEWRGYKPEIVDLPESAKQADPTGERVGNHRNVDVLVIGGGIVGISTALFLARGGIEVLVVEAGQINGQASGGNAGSLHLQLLSFDFTAADAAGTSPAIQTLRLQKLGIELWLALERELNADFEIKITGGLMVAETEQDMAFLKEKTEAEQRMGIDMELLGPQELRSVAPAVSERMIGAAFCPGEGKINPLLATPGLRRAAVDRGAEIVTDARVVAIERDGKGFQVSTSAGPIRCQRIVNAAGAWSRATANLAGLELPVQSAPQQMIVTEAAEPLLDHMVAHAHRHLTMKQASNGNLIIGGGWFAGFDRNLGRPRTLIDAIAGNLWIAQRVVPAIEDLNVIRTWAAAGVTIDGAPIIGEAPGVPGLFNAVGANGFTMGPILGKTTAELITCGKSEIDLRPFALERLAPVAT